MDWEIPTRPALEGLEAKWAARWEADGTFEFDRSKRRDEVFSIDTPPPTVSGALHPGHACSYTQADLVARYRRMAGSEVFYPMGWDDNGLNVERRVQIMRGVICDPSLPYDPGFAPPTPPPRRPVHISRPNFVEQCAEVTAELEAAYRDLWTTLGLSVDWSLTYETIGDRARAASQRGFVELLDRGIVYRAEAPTLWDVDFRTAIAQAEVQDREVPSAYHRLRFHGPDGHPVFVDTTRPELLPACVAVVAHPDDQRYHSLVGSHVTTPVFRASVPVHAHRLADPDKGTGLAMVCTFGDLTDVTWWRELDLPIRSVIGRDGRLTATAPDGVLAGPYGALAGRRADEARAAVVELLESAGALAGRPSPVAHAVKFWENGTVPLEIVTSRQWFVRYPPKDELLQYGRRLRWHPEYMRARYENWVDGLAGDWNITRQRFFGVPFPVWYPIDAGGDVQWDDPIVAPADRLPVDPTTDVPDGYAEDQRNRPGGFAADPDVMDTWATSSLSPQIVGGWHRDDDLFHRVFPMDLRPQAHDIIRTWLFYTVVRSHYHHGSLPWSDAAISGFVYDPDRKKLSKSAANASDDPMTLIRRHGADAVRYWAARGRLGSDVALDPNQFRIGRRLATKVLNASRFVLSVGSPADDGGVVDRPLDLAMLADLAGTVAAATEAFDDYDYSRALERVESFFWRFCDDYLELVKGRAYGQMEEADGASARAALLRALSVLLRLLAPFLPFVTEDVWSWWRPGSVHRASWPTVADLDGAGRGDVAVLEAATEVLGHVRKAKSDASLPMRAEVASVVVSGPAERAAAVEAALDDLRAAGRIAELRVVEDDGFAVAVTLAGTG